MDSPNSARPSKLADYTKQRGNHHLCAKNKALTAMTKTFLSHERHSHYKGIPSMVTISERSMDTTDTDDDCAHQSAELNEFFLKVSPSDSGPEISSRSLDTTYSATSSVEPIHFFLKIPPRNQRRRSDLREIFQSSRSQSGKKTSILQSILSESSTTPLASRRLPSSSSNSDSFRIV